MSPPITHLSRLQCSDFRIGNISRGRETTLITQIPPDETHKNLSKLETEKDSLKVKEKTFFLNLTETTSNF